MREDRWQEEPRRQDQRTPGQRDRDRVLYSNYLRRLANVTQVVGPIEGHVFHNRLTHTLEVAQIARRIAEKLLNEQPNFAEQLGGIDPDVVEAAALAHDLGHPPFGHIAEQELNKLVKHYGVFDGFDGNAQSFRIVTHIAAHRTSYRGLNLTRATLNAILKYPQLYQPGVDKFGAFKTEEEYFVFARQGYQDKRSIEAEIMDYADDIAYSVHDFFDFSKAGLIPTERFRFVESFREEFYIHWIESGKILPTEVEEGKEAIENLVDTLYTTPYEGTFEQRATISTNSSALIKEFVYAAQLQAPDGSIRLYMEPHILLQIRFLKRLVYESVICNPQLTTQQYGQRKIIKKLFSVYYRAVKKQEVDLIPPEFHADLSLLVEEQDDAKRLEKELRLTSDILSSFSDDQAVTIFRRLTGITPGSVVDLLYK